MKLKILSDGDVKLKTKSEEVQLPLTKENIKFAKSLLDYLEYSSDPQHKVRPGIGIAAVQVGVLKRIFAVRIPLDINDFFKEILVNPKIIYKNGRAALEGGEGCLSVHQDITGLVHRSYEIKIKGFSVLKNQDVEYHLKGYLAIVFQHEYDHLEGKLYYSRINMLYPNKAKTNEILI